MPELPEVETIKNILNNFVINRTIREVKILNRNTIQGDESLFRQALLQQTINQVSRLGKFLIFHLSNNVVFLSHLRMEGKYFFYEKDQGVYDKHACVIFFFNDGSVLEYNDTRKFGLMKLDKHSSYLDNLPLSKLGPEPFAIKSVDVLMQKAKKKQIPIKVLLLDQTFISGLGNIYVDEVLFKTKIHPETPANLISKVQMEELVAASVDVLKMAINSGGSTIRSYHPSQGIDGGFQTKLHSYGRENLPCLRCNHPLRKTFVGGRGTTFCPKCQKNPASPHVVGITGPIGSGKSSVAEYYRQHGYQALSGDAIVADLYQDGKVRALISKLFGANVILDDKNINKDLIIATIIEEPNKKRKLEKILHPRVEEVIIKKIKTMKRDEKLVLEIPLLFESKLDDYCNETIYVDINPEIQKKRLENRRIPVEISLALNAGFDAKHNKQKATFVIDNSDSLDDLHHSLEKIIS